MTLSPSASKLAKRVQASAAPISKDSKNARTASSVRNTARFKILFQMAILTIMTCLEGLYVCCLALVLDAGRSGAERGVR